MVAKHIAGMIQDDVEDDTDAQSVRGLDEPAKVPAAPEVRVDLEKVLNAVSVVRLVGPDLLEDRADPDRRDAEPPQITELGLQSGKCSADEPPSRVPPAIGVRCISDRAAVGLGTNGGVVPVVTIWPWLSRKRFSAPSENRSSSRK